MDRVLLIEQLFSVGMTRWEAKLYLAMLEKPDSTAADLHRISGVLRTKVYETLEKMLSKGYCQERMEGNRRYFLPISPELLKQNFSSQMMEKIDVIKDTFETLVDYYDTNRSSEPKLDSIEILRNDDQIHQRFVNLTQETESEILSFSRSPYSCIKAQTTSAQVEANIECIRKGVLNRTIYQLEEEHLGWLKDCLAQYVQEGEDIRVIQHLPLKMFVYDRRKVMLLLTYEDNAPQMEYSMVTIDDKGFAEACAVLFETYWEKATPFEVDMLEEICE